MANKLSSKAKYDRYKSNHTREKNKLRHVLKHLKKHPNDEFAKKEVVRLQEIISKR